MIVLIDNYDSFTYNLVQKLGEVSPGVEMKVFRNDKVTVDEIELLGPTHIVVSPGPCTPKEAGISNEIIRHFGPKVPVLGVCLGHQCIGHVSGGVADAWEDRPDPSRWEDDLCGDAQPVHGDALPLADHPQRHAAGGV